MKKITALFLLFTIGILIIILSGTIAIAQTGRVDVTSKKKFKVTADAVVKAIKARGMMVVSEIDHQNMLTMVGTKIAGSKTIEFGKPDMGKMVLSMSPEAGLEMPAKIYIFEKSGKTTLSYYKTDFAKYSPGFSKVDEMMNMMFNEIVQEAAK